MPVPEEEDPRLQQALARSWHSLEKVSSEPDAKQWVTSCAATEPGTDKLLQLLEEHVSRPSFLAELEAARAAALTGDAPEPPSSPGTALPAGEGLQADWWEVRSDGEFASVSECTGDYVVIEHSDVILAFSYFIAAYVVTLPEATSSDTRQLQAALAQTMQELRKGKVRRLLDWGRTIYRAVAVSYGAFSAYTNPWLAKAVLTVLLTGVKMLAGLVV